MKKLIVAAVVAVVASTLGGCVGSLVHPQHSYMQSKRAYDKQACAQALQQGWCYDGCREQPFNCKPHAQISIGVHGSVGATAHR